MSWQNIKILPSDRYSLFILGLCFCLGSHAEAASSTRKQHPLTLADGSTLNIHSRCPSDSSGRQWPAVLLFGGFETGAGAIDLIDPQSAICLVTFQYPFSVPHKFRFPEDLKLLPTAKAALHDTVSGISRLVDWVATRPELDPKKIVLVGASFGAPFVSIVAGERKEVAALILVHGFGDVPEVISYRIAAEWEVKYGLPGRWLAALAGRILWWYAGISSPEESLRKMGSHQRVLMLTAKDDDLLPSSAVESMRNAVRKSSASWQEKKLPGAHLRPGETELLARLLAESSSWLREQGIISK